MKNNRNYDYINEIIRHLNNQQKHMIYYISFNLGIIVLTLNGILFKDNSIVLSNEIKIILISSLILILLSTFFYNKWRGRLHLLRIRATELLFNEDVKTARKIHYPGNEYWKKHGWIYKVGNKCQLFGILLYVVFIIMIIIKIH